MSPDRPAPSHVIAHLSDPHLRADGLFAGRIDSAARLRECLERVAASGERIDAVVVSGDLTATAAPAAYELLRGILEPAAQRLGAALVVVAGNHDERRPLARALTGADSDAPLDTVTTIRGLRILGLDSCRPGYHSGGLSDEQYDWLSGQLATPAEHGTLLVMHHPPLAYRSTLMQLLDFDDPGRLADVVRGSDVRAILGGHLHAPTFGALDGIPVFVAAGVSYVDDAAAPRGALLAVDGPQSWNLVEVHADQVTCTVAPARAHPSWSALSQEVLDLLAEVAGEDRRELFSRKRG